MDHEALCKLGYGVCVVTSKEDNGINGQIANTIFQVTSEPPTSTSVVLDNAVSCLEARGTKETDLAKRTISVSEAVDAGGGIRGHPLMTSLTPGYALSAGQPRTDFEKVD
jgi:hypothetical protein